MYLQAFEKAGGFDVVEDEIDEKSDVYFVAGGKLGYREDLHQRLLRLREGARVNHFPGMIDVCEKVSFARAIRQRTLFCPRLAEFVPMTWLLPEEFGLVLQKMEDVVQSGCGPRSFIVKPEYGLQGNGIFIVRNKADLQVACATRGITEASSSYVCQEYIADPLTLDGFKFDLRIYLVLTSLAPLEGYVCREGLARFCTTPYAAPTAMNINVRTGHLTNYALNKKEDTFERSEAGASPESASKRLLSTALQQIRSRSDGQFCEARFWSQVEEISSLLLVTVLPSLAFATSQYFPVNEVETSRCYHVLGLDVLLDSNYRPWLLEVNSAPAMDIETAVPVQEAAQPKRLAATASQPELRKVAKGSNTSVGKLSRLSKSSSSRHVGQASRQASTDLSTSTSAPTLPLMENSRSTEEIQQPPPPPEVKRKQKRKKQVAKKKADSHKEIVLPKYTDDWNGYQPSMMRRRLPFPQVCSCRGHTRPHRHVVCEVDEYSKVFLMARVLRKVVGNESDIEGFIKVSFPPESARVVRSMWSFVDLCGRLNGMRTGVSGASLRKALQASEEITQRSTSTSQGKGRLGQHVIDYLTSDNSRWSHALHQPKHPCSATMALFPVFDMLLEVSRRCCEKDPALAECSPIEKFEWLMEAIKSASTGDPLARRVQDTAVRYGRSASLPHSVAARRASKLELP